MKLQNLIFAVKDLYKNYFNGHGRLSRAGYWWAWLGISLVNILFVLLFVLLAKVAGGPLLKLIVLWNIATFFPMLFAAMRRYHDSGKPGWLAIVCGAFSRICTLTGLGIVLLSVMVAAFGAGASMNDSAFNLIVMLGGVAFLTGIILCIFNLLFLLRGSSPEENPYGMPRPFYPEEGSLGGIEDEKNC